MAQEELTDSLIRHHSTPEKTIEISDTMAAGLVVRITKTGHKSFVFRYRFGDKVRRFTMGTFPTLRLAKARKMAENLHIQVKQGTDPKADRDQKLKKTTTFKQLADRFKKIHLPGLSPFTQDEYERIIDVELIPVIGNKPAKDITRSDVVEILDNKAIAEGRKTMANKIRARLHTIFEFGIQKEIVEHNPVSRTKPYKSTPDNDRVYDKDELKLLWDSFDQLTEPARSYFKIITLTGQRRTETQYMKWEHVRKIQDNDFTGWVWQIPAELSKSNRAHLVPLSPHAIEIIEGLRERAAGNPYVFSSLQSPGNPFALRTIKRAVRDLRKSTVVGDFRLHDMRRTVATYLAKIGTRQEVTSKILNHKTGAGGSQVTQIYNRYEYRRERQQALNLWADHLQRILSGEDSKIAGKIG
jgi:integrase